MTEPEPNKPVREQATRDALIAAAMRLFGKNGYAATSIREIAAEAGTNSASIAYHFGGKEGLRRACAETIADHLKNLLGPVLLSAGPAPDAQTAVRTLEQLARAMASFMLTRPEADNIAPFMLREVSDPGEVLDIVYDRILKPVHTQACRIWAAATGGDAESEDTKIEVFAMIGQLLYFRIGREIVLRRLGWQTVSTKEAERIADVLTANIRAMVAAGQKGP